MFILYILNISRYINHNRKISNSFIYKNNKLHNITIQKITLLLNNQRANICMQTLPFKGIFRLLSLCCMHTAAGLTLEFGRNRPTC